MNSISSIQDQITGILNNMQWNEEYEECDPSPQEVSGAISGLMKSFADAAAHIDDENQKEMFYQSLLEAVEQGKNFSLNRFHILGEQCRYLIGYEREDGVFKPFENGLLLGQTSKTQTVDKRISYCLAYTASLPHEDEELDKATMKTYAQAWELFYHFSKLQDLQSIYHLIGLLAYTENLSKQDISLLKQVFEKYNQFDKLKYLISQFIAQPQLSIADAAKILLDDFVNQENLSQTSEDLNVYLSVLDACSLFEWWSFKPKQFLKVRQDKDIWNRVLGIHSFLKSFHYYELGFPHANVGHTEKDVRQRTMDMFNYRKFKVDALSNLRESVIRLCVNENMDFVNLTSKWFQNIGIIRLHQTNEIEWKGYSHYLGNNHKYELSQIPQLLDIFVRYDQEYFGNPLN